MPEQKFLTNIELDGDLIDINGNPGTSGQILSSLGSGNGVDWIDNSSTATSAEKVSLEVRFEEAVSKGDPVYVSGFHGSNGPVKVSKARSDDSDKMPAFGLADDNYSQNSTGHAVSLGNLDDIDTSSYSIGDTLYVAPTGGLTSTKPTGVNKIQNVGTVSRSSQNNGSIEVTATGRSNDVPTPLYIDHDNQRVGIGIESPTTKLVVSEARSGSTAADQTKYTLVSRSTISSGTPGTGGIKVVYDDGTNEHGFGLVSGSSSADFLTTGPMHFYTNSDLNTQSATGLAMVLDTSQRLGIGTTSPSQKLEVVGAAKLHGNLIFDDSYNVVGGDALELQTGGSTKIVIDSSDGGILMDNGSGGLESDTFKTNFDDNIFTGNVSISGNVGIGTTSPSEKLHVVGSALIEGSSTELKVRGSGAYDTANIVMGNSAHDSFSIDTRNDPGDNKTTLSFDSYQTTGTSTITLGDNYINFGTAASNRMSISSTGNVGIGTTSPDYKLEVNGTLGLTGYIFHVGDSNSYFGFPSNDTIIAATAGSERMRIDSSGDVGIGTDSPRTKLDINGPLAVIGGTFTSGDSSADSSSSAGIVLRRGKKIFSGIPNGGNEDFYLRNLIEQDTGNNINIGQTGTSLIGDISLSTGTSGNVIFRTTGSESVRINSSGNVGIGTTSPDRLLDVDGNTGIKVQNSGDVIFEADPTAGTFQLGDVGGVGGTAYIAGDNTNIDFFGDGDVRFQNDGNVGIGTSSPDRSLVINHASDTRVKLQVNGTDTAQIQTLANQARYHALGSSASLQLWTNGAERARIDTSGDMGIGTTSPDEKLHVNGNTRITSRLYNTQHTSSSLSANNWYRIIEITGSSGRGKCEFSIGGSGGSGTPSLVKATVNTAWSNANSTIKVDFNSKSSAFTEFRVVRNSSSNKSFVDVKVGAAEDSVLLQVYPIAWADAYAVDFTQVTTLPSGDSVETSVPLTNTAFALANNNGSDVDPVFKVDHDSKAYAEEFIGQRVIVNGNAYHGTANTVFALYTTAVGMTSSTSNSRHYPYAAIIMPFNGVVEKVIIKNIQYSSYTSGPSASGTARIQLNQYDSTYAPMDYSSGNVSFTAAANVSMTFSPNESYNEGTHFRVFFNSSAVWRYISYQIILKQTS